ncbi:MAG TPA: SLC13 family permease [Flavobacteriaceae bacterium]|nr:SLC13 family permease [Flavobacteriaceae bacterium]
MEQTLVFVTLVLSLVLFIWGKVRYDVVAFLSLFFLVLTGVIGSSEAFLGFSHPAVITVAAVLVISKAMQYSGLVDVLADFVSQISNKLWVQIILLCSIVALASGFINNIGALAITMPIALHLARKNKFSPSLLLMPLAFTSILGGMTTLIGTPPNIIISTFREEAVGERFSMFDFSPVGVVLTVVCLAYITLIGWRFLPKRRSAESVGNMFEIDNYITEVIVTEDSKINEQKILHVSEISKSDIIILGIIRNGLHKHAPSPWEVLHKNDILIIEADTDELKTFISNTNTILAEGGSARKAAVGAEDIITAEAIVLPNSILINHTAKDFRIRTRYHINILGIARQNRKINKRISQMTFKEGDILLLQGQDENIKEATRSLNCLPLAKREISLGKPKRILGALSIFLSAILCVVFGLLKVEIAFSLAAVLMVISKIIPVKEVYNSIDWPVIVLLAFMIPIGNAFETSGGAETISNLIISLGYDKPVWLYASILMVITVLLSDVINNTATVVLMAPIALKIANNLNISPDPMLMIVAVAGSCAFLTPIGHHSSTLVMGPGGYKYGDYWKLGLPLTLLICILGVPLILYIWPA